MWLVSEAVLVVGTVVVTCVVVSTIGAAVLVVLGVEVYEEWKLDGYPWFGKGWWAASRKFFARQYERVLTQKANWSTLRGNSATPS